MLDGRRPELCDILMNNFWQPGEVGRQQVFGVPGPDTGRVSRDYRSDISSYQIFFSFFPPSQFSLARSFRRISVLFCRFDQDFTFILKIKSIVDKKNHLPTMMSGFERRLDLYLVSSGATAPSDEHLVISRTFKINCYLLRKIVQTTCTSLNSAASLE